ncbi:hypothetical protein GOP47_0010394 [Adiantum capillus-veneris]|uniref:Uncharacterized protein n=1 Tax=Adiantum capillus-veneris TaxID=13818 RepID=A0A9D4UVS8_ADICA|nr:hypothetical protein GOP47_0010394 [Adiantum capillus-veneris]
MGLEHLSEDGVLPVLALWSFPRVVELVWNSTPSSLLRPGAWGGDVQQGSVRMQAREEATPRYCGEMGLGDSKASLT